MDPGEARQSRLDLKAFKSCIGEILGDDSDRMTVIAFSRQDDLPVALAAFKKRAYDTNILVNLPGQTIRSDIVNTRRKSLWEVEYVVRRLEYKSQCLGDIVLSCGLEKLGELSISQSRVTTNVWLIVSNSFLNSPAIYLYLSCGFQMSCMYQSTLMMVLFDLDQQRVENRCSAMQSHVESKFLLPHLKSSVQQPECPASHELPMSSDQQV